MSILSFSFLCFFTLFFIIYFLVPKKLQVYILLAGNIYFYVMFGYMPFLFILFTTITTFFAAYFIEKHDENQQIRKKILWTTIITNISILIFTKFLTYSTKMWNLLFHSNIALIKIIVPLGISFYTLQALSYVIDIYRKKYKTEKNLLHYLTYMTFFPIIMQGPISRYDQLSKSLLEEHHFKYNRIATGLQLVLWGLFKKMVIADRAAIFVNQLFNNYDTHTGFSIAIAALLYSIQIYTDFSGFVDISRGLSQILGINITNNFNRPYFTTSIAEFWRCWHISLSNWLRDYVYISLGGNRKGKVRKYINIFIIFVISGIWHGVGIHYIAWGIIHGLYQIIGSLTKPIKNKIATLIKIKQDVFSYRLLQQIINFALLTFAWMFFRGNGLGATFLMIKTLFVQFGPISVSELISILSESNWIVLIISILILWGTEFAMGFFDIRNKISEQNMWFRWSIYLLLFLSILILGIYGPGFSQGDFIYMNF